MTNVLLSPDASDRELALALEKLAVRACRWPALAIDSPVDDAPLREAIENIFGYDWLIFKNGRAADYFMRSFLRKHSRDELDDLRVLSIGADAADKASEFQIHVDLAVERCATQTIYNELKSYVGEAELARLNLLIPNANVSHELFEEQLEVGGARVDCVAAYRTCADSDQLAKLQALLAGGGIDYVAFTKPSAVNEFACLLDTDDLSRLLSDVTVVCSDQSTAARAEEFGLAPEQTPSETSVHQLADFIKQFRI
jgi:uroporphyrinogen-III synthase